VANIGKFSENIGAIYDYERDVYVSNADIGRGAGERIPGLTTGANAAQAGQVAAPESGCAAGPTAESLHVKPPCDGIVGSKYRSAALGDELPAKQFDRDQAVRDEIRRRYNEIRGQVAQQQSALLNQLGEEAKAPAYETAPLGYGLGSRIESLETQVRLMNKHLAALGQQLLDVQRRVFAPPSVLGDRVSVPSAASQSGATIRRRVEAAGITAPPRGEIVIADDVVGCEHDMLKANTTVSAITRKKARCNVCAQVWETA
jgi:hypothetical protein